MSTVESPRTKVFSFRAPEELEGRIDRARATLANVIDLDSPEGGQIVHEMELALLRRPHRLTRTASQSDLLRALVELLLAATEKVERDRVTGDAYAAAAAERSEEERDFTRASTRAAARRWR